MIERATITLNQKCLHFNYYIPLQKKES